MGEVVVFIDELSAIGRSTRRWAVRFGGFVAHHRTALLGVFLALTGCASSPEREMAMVGAPVVAERDLCNERYVKYQPPVMTREMARESRRGWVLVTFLLSSDGEPEDVRVRSEGASPKLIEAVEGAVLSASFNRAEAARECNLLFTFREVVG